MSKRDDLDRIAASAIEQFSEWGYEGTSLRDIAAHAAVTLSRIDRYFGSKLDLFNEIQRRVWLKISAERDELLRRPISTDANGEPTLEAVLYAFVYPIAERSIPQGDGAPWVRLLRESRAVRTRMGLKCGPPPVARGAEKWISKIMRACPALDRDRAVWLLSFVISVTNSAHLTNSWFDDFLSSDRPYEASEITMLVVSFCRAGIDAVERDAPTRPGTRRPSHADPPHLSTRLADADICT